MTTADQMRDWRDRPGNRDRGRAYSRATARAQKRLAKTYPGVFKRYLREELVRAEDELRLGETS